MLCNHGVPFAQILRKKSVKTYAGNLVHLTMSHRFFFKKLLLTLYEHDVFIFCICLGISSRNHSPTLWIITPQPWRIATLPSGRWVGLLKVAAILSEIIQLNLVIGTVSWLIFPGDFIVIISERLSNCLSSF